MSKLSKMSKMSVSRTVAICNWLANISPWPYGNPHGAHVEEDEEDKDEVGGGGGLVDSMPCRGFGVVDTVVHARTSVCGLGRGLVETDS